MFMFSSRPRIHAQIVTYTMVIYFYEKNVFKQGIMAGWLAGVH